MNINIKANNLELTKEIKEYVQKKMDMLDKYLGKLRAVHCDVEISLATNHHLKGEIYTAEVNLEIPGDLIRVEKSEKDLHKAIDKVKDHLKDVISKRKEKLIDKKRRSKEE